MLFFHNLTNNGNDRYDNFMIIGIQLLPGLGITWNSHQERCLFDFNAQVHSVSVV